MKEKELNIVPKYFRDRIFFTIKGINDIGQEKDFIKRDHSYYVRKLVKDNPNAACDISGEKDRRFLVLHHLHNKANGGQNSEENYVVLSNNYHLAFHKWNKGYSTKCTKEDYLKFKEEELKRKNNG